MSLTRISHIGIAVRDLDRQVAVYRDLLGMELVTIEEVAEQQVRVAMLQVGESTIELLTPTTEESPVARFLDKRGEGIHHLAYQVDDIAAELARLQASGAQLIDEVPRQGAHGKRIAFIHPRSTGGVLTELCE